eukprot:Em0024g53a
MAATERYSFSLTTFSPSGKLVQIEYALQAVAAGAPSVGIKAKNGIVLAAEKKQKSILHDESTIHKIESVNDKAGIVYSGMGPDYRLLVARARKIAQKYYLTYHEPIPVSQLVQGVATVMQEYTQFGGVRPFGVSLLIAGYDEDTPYLFQCDPSGAYFAWKATAMGKNYINGKTFLEKRTGDWQTRCVDSKHEFGAKRMWSLCYLVSSFCPELHDPYHLIDSEGFDGQMTEDNIEIAICNTEGFRRLEPHEVKDYLTAIL